MVVNLNTYTATQRVIVTIKLIIINIIVALIATIGIYIINTYWYQESKLNANKIKSDFFSKSINDIEAYNTNNYIEKTKEIINKTNAKISVEIVSKKNNKEQYYIENRKMDEYKNSNYFVDYKNFNISIFNQPYSLEYIYKKRVGSNLLYDVLDALTFSISIDKSKIKKFNLHQKSYVFYSYFIIIFIGLYIASFIYERMKKKLNIQETELTDLIKRYENEILLQEEYSKSQKSKLTNSVKRYKDKILKQEISMKKQKHYNAMSEIDASMAKLELSIEKEKHDSTISKMNTMIVEIEKIEKINDKTHIKELKDCLIHAKDSIYILSGWISTTVLDSHVMYLFEEALKRKVDIYIGFGYGSKAGECNSLKILKDQQYQAL